MKIDSLKIRVNELISLADKTLNNQWEDSYGYYVKVEEYIELRSACLSFIKSTFGDSHPFYKEFNSQINSATPHYVQQARGILKAIKQEIDGGWIFSVKGIVSAEIFSDFMEMAEHLLSEGYKDATAVMIGSVLEEHLRQLCKKNSIDVEISKGEKLIPKRADSLNNELCSAGIYNMLDQKTVTSWLDLRNKAAHGKYTEYSKEQVDLMYQGVNNFISRTI
ncbi:hypothetical protein [Flavobacterium sp.]|uniref:hypothetical protein n=1 Tax=Flavobacterium sp. TaxID=239 RepID=UPI00261E6EBF|nr:hypothetical protein [Flavobacterium sp.]